MDELVQGQSIHAGHSSTVVSNCEYKTLVLILVQSALKVSLYNDNKGIYMLCK